jgi:hypothetical protein
MSRTAGFSKAAKEYSFEGVASPGIPLSRLERGTCDPKTCFDLQRSLSLGWGCLACNERSLQAWADAHTDDVTLLGLT